MGYLINFSKFAAISIMTGGLLAACGGGSSNNTTSSVAVAPVAGNATDTVTSDTTPADTDDAATTDDSAATDAEEPVVEAPPVHVYSSRYVKLDSMGNALPPESESWACIRDTATGLLWESKTDDGGLRDKGWRYRHFHNFGGYASSVDFNGNLLCRDVGSASCDAYTYVNALNGTALCGRNNWRLPLLEELLVLIQVNADGSRPNIDLDFFPDTVNAPGKAAYCSENMNTYLTCGDNYTVPDGVDPNTRVECNYQGVDYGLAIRPENMRGDSMVALRYYGEVRDGLTEYPNANWLCHTRLVSSF